MSNTNQKTKILVVEDNPSFQEIYEEILGTDYDLEIVESKEKAVEFLQRQMPEIALIDMRLKADERGNTDGLEIGQFVRDLGYKTILILKSGFPTETSEITAHIEKLDVFKVLDKNAEDQLEQLVSAVAEASVRVRSFTPTSQKNYMTSSKEQVRGENEKR